MSLSDHHVLCACFLIAVCGLFCDLDSRIYLIKLRDNVTSLVPVLLMVLVMFVSFCML